MNRIEVTLPRMQWEGIRDAADKASPASLYKDYPGLFTSYNEIFRISKDALEAHPGAQELTINLVPETLSSLRNLPEFAAFRRELPQS